MEEGGAKMNGRGVTLPDGFLAAGVTCGIKESGRPDLALIYSAETCSAAGVFTKNLFAAAPVRLSRERLTSGSCRAILINSGNANACTGKQGEADAREMADLTASELKIDVDLAVVNSTGVIGRPLPMEHVRAGIGLAVRALSREGGEEAAQAILTTDTRPKQAGTEILIDDRRVRIGAMAKGSGMIAPSMATMIAVLTTDAAVVPEALRDILGEAVADSFNLISVDGCQSTNDSVFALASGAAGNQPIQRTGQTPILDEAFRSVCRDLAQQIVRDGEGASKLISVTVEGAASVEEARRSALAVVNSNLLKAAVFGCDPNWGRALAALGAADVDLDPHRVDLDLASYPLVRGGEPCRFDKQGVARAMEGDYVPLVFRLHRGNGAATAWGCDLSYDYVRINAEYTT